MRCLLLIPASRHEMSKCGIVRVEVTHLNPQPPVVRANRSLTQAKVTAADKWGWQHIRPACTHTSKDLCPRSVNHKALPQRKSPGQAHDYIKRQGCQVLLSMPNVPFFPTHLLNLSSFPFMLSRSFDCLHIHHSLSHSLKVSLVHSCTDIFSHLCFLHHRFLCHSESLQTLQTLQSV